MRHPSARRDFRDRHGHQGCGNAGTAALAWVRFVDPTQLSIGSARLPPIYPDRAGEFTVAKDQYVRPATDVYVVPHVIWRRPPGDHPETGFTRLYGGSTRPARLSHARMKFPGTSGHSRGLRHASPSPPPKSPPNISMQVKSLHRCSIGQSVTPTTSTQSWMAVLSVTALCLLTQKRGGDGAPPSKDPFWWEEGQLSGEAMTCTARESIGPPFARSISLPPLQNSRSSLRSPA